MRVTPDQLKNSITPISSSVKNDRRYMAESKPLSSFYDINGKESSSLDDEACYARTIHGMGGSKHQIVTNQKDEVYLKDDDFYLNDSNRFAKLNGMGSRPYKFVQVSKETLIAYVNYLRTGSLISLNKAQSGL